MRCYPSDVWTSPAWAFPRTCASTRPHRGAFGVAATAQEKQLALVCLAPADARRRCVPAPLLCTPSATRPLARTRTCHGPPLTPRRPHLHAISCVLGSKVCFVVFSQPRANWKSSSPATTHRAAARSGSNAESDSYADGSQTQAKTVTTGCSRAPA